jgi:hypothetical protein
MEKKLEWTSKFAELLDIRRACSISDDDVIYLLKKHGLKIYFLKGKG